MTEPAPRKGLVTRKLLSEYLVESDDGVYACAPSNSLRKSLVYSRASESSRPTGRALRVEDIPDIDPIAVGDMVEFIAGSQKTGLIKTVLPSHNELTRAAAGRAPRRQVIVANVDQVVAIVSAANPEPNWQLLDRLLVTVEAAAITPVVCFTKLDLVSRFAEADIYRRAGYRTILTSVVTGQAVQQVAELLAGAVSVLVGMSGVGKSSLLNTISPSLDLTVDEVSAASQKGRHTTTHVEMHTLESGGRVVDTPGLKYFGLWDISPGDVAELFPEFRPLLGTCRFRSCEHMHEPGCALKEALRVGDIAASRYDSYRAMLGAARQEY